MIKISNSIPPNLARYSGLVSKGLIIRTLKKARCRISKARSIPIFSITSSESRIPAVSTNLKLVPSI